MSTKTGLSSCCLSGTLHSGTPSGSVETIDKLSTYVSKPTSGSRAKSIIFLTDIFGYKLNNVRLLADSYARAGFYAYIPDLFMGDALPEDFLQSVEPPLKVQQDLSLVDKAKNTATVGTTLPPWLVKHREAVVKPLIDSFISTVRAMEGTGKVGAVGFCFGGRYAILAAHGEADAAYACHPALLSIPADLEGVSRPLSLAVGDHDSLLDNDSVGKIKEVLAKNTSVPHEVTVYDDQVHGFALRGDWSSDKDAKSMDSAEKQGIAWFEKYLA